MLDHRLRLPVAGHSSLQSSAAQRDRFGPTKKAMNRRPLVKGIGIGRGAFVNHSLHRGRTSYASQSSADAKSRRCARRRIRHPPANLDTASIPERRTAIETVSGSRSSSGIGGEQQGVAPLTRHPRRRVSVIEPEEPPHWVLRRRTRQRLEPSSRRQPSDQVRAHGRARGLRSGAVFAVARQNSTLDAGLMRSVERRSRELPRRRALRRAGCRREPRASATHAGTLPERAARPVGGEVPWSQFLACVRGGRCSVDCAV